MRQLSDYMFAVRAAGAPPAPDGVPVIDLPPGEGDDVVARVVGGLRDSGLKPADFRSRVIFLAAPGPDLLVQYAALCGFAARRVDVFVEDTLLELLTLHERTVGTADAGKPPMFVTWAQAGGDSVEGLPSVPFGPEEVLSPHAVSVVRYAARLRLVPGATAAQTLRRFIVVAALRQRGVVERFPFLSTGTEPLPKSKSDPGQGVDLEKVRRQSWAFRQEFRADRHQVEIVPPVPVLAHNRRIAEANTRDIGDLLRRLGSTQTEDGFWGCPRPERHNNGDRNPSMRVHKGNKVRCPRCDAELISPVRLLMDVLGLTPDEAAAFILDSTRTVDTRNRVSAAR